jgi:hypothetical protein
MAEGLGSSVLLPVEYRTRRYPPIIAQALEGAGRDEEHRCDSHEGDGRIRNDFLQIYLVSGVPTLLCRVQPRSQESKSPRSVKTKTLTLTLTLVHSQQKSK